MARPPRIEFAGTLYHITSRGDGREDICLDDADREGLSGFRQFHFIIIPFTII